MKKTDLVNHLNTCLKNEDFKEFEKEIGKLNKSENNGKITFQKALNTLKENDLVFTIYKTK